MNGRTCLTQCSISVFILEARVSRIIHVIFFSQILASTVFVMRSYNISCIFQVRPKVDTDIKRLWSDTKAWEARFKESEEIILQKPLFEVNSFTSNQVRFLLYILFSTYLKTYLFVISVDYPVNFPFKKAYTFTRKKCYIYL